MKKTTKKNSIAKRALVAGMTIAVSCSTFAGCQMTSNSTLDNTTENVGVVKAMDKAMVKRLNNSEVVSSTAELVDDGYNVTIITENSVEQFTLDSDMQVTSSGEVQPSTSTESSTSSETSTPSTSIPSTPITGNVNKQAISDLLTSIGNSVIDEADRAVIESVLNDITPENVTIAVSNLQAAYAQAITFADLNATEILELDFSRENYMGIDALVVEFKTTDAKYDYVFNADTLALYESSIKLNATEASEDSSYIEQSVAVEKALKIVGASQDDVTKFKVKVDRHKSKRVYKIKFSYDAYNYQIYINALTGDVVKFEKEIVKDEILTTAIPTAKTKEEALQIAAAFAGIDLSLTDETFKSKIKLDYEDDAFVYEIEFKYNKVEYEFDIDPSNGEVLDFDKDDDDDDKLVIGKDKNKNDKDDNKNEVGKKKPVSPFIITEEQAKQAVLTSVNDESAIIISVEVEQEKTKDINYYFYEIEVRTTNALFEYEVNATDGIATMVKQKIYEDKKPGGATDKDYEHWGWDDDEDLEEEIEIDVITALDKAFKSASTTASEAKIRKIELKKNGIYHIKFSVNSIEYSFEINAKTGEIVKNDCIFD